MLPIFVSENMISIHSWLKSAIQITMAEHEKKVSEQIKLLIKREKCDPQC